MILIGVLFLASLIFLLRTWWYSCSGWLQFDSSIPSPPVNNLIFGHARAVKPNMYGEEGLAYITKWGLIYPKLLKFRVGFYYILATAHPSYIKALVKDRPEKHFHYNIARNWVGDGLLFSAGEKWYARRKLLTPSFHFDKLKSYTHIFNETTDIMIEQLKKSNGEAVEIYPSAVSLTMDTILRCLLSFKSDCQSQMSEYAELMYKLSEISINRMNNPEKMIDCVFFLTNAGREYLKLRERFWSIGREIVMKRQEEHKNNPRMLDDVNNLTFLDVLLTLKYEDGTNLTIEEVLEEVNVFAFAGHDTTASAISWILFQLCQNPQCMAKCYQEICDIFDAEDCGQYVQQQHLNSLTYFSMCIKECLRLKPPVFAIGRSVVKDVTIDGHFLPKGTTLTTLIEVLHKSEEFWEKPLEFIPERFSVEKSRDRDPYSYLPFSVGNRNCIGQNFATTELKMAVAKMIYNFEVIVIRPEDVTRICTMIQKPVNLFLEFRPRRQ